MCRQRLKRHNKMSTSVLNTTSLDFLSSGSTQAKFTASADTITFEGTSSGTCVLSGISNPVAGTDGANKQYVDDLSAGVQWKEPVIAASTANLTLASNVENGDSIDGITLATGDRVLLKDQTTGSENGIWIVSASGAPTRPTDFYTGDDVASSAVFVQDGTINADVGFVCTSDTGSAVVDTNALVFVQFNGAANITAGDGMTKNGNTLAVDTSVIRTTGAQTLGGAKTFSATSVHQGGVSISADNQNFVLGASSDLTLVHNGTDTVLTSTTGDLIYDNVNTVGVTANRLGTDTNTSSFQVQNNSETALFTVDGSGQVDIGGNINASGGIDIDADNVSLTVGGSAELTVVHDGTDTVLTNTTGDLVIRNTNANGEIAMNLGSSNSSAHFCVHNDTGDDVVTFYANRTSTFDGNVTTHGDIVRNITVTTDSTVGNRVYTATEMKGGVIRRDPSGSARSDITATAAQIVADIHDCVVGSAYEFVVMNTADASEVITIGAGTGVSLVGTFTVLQNEVRRFELVVTNAAASSEAVTIYALTSNGEGAATPAGGNNTEIQYNNSGSFAGASTITTDGTDLTFNGGDLNIGDTDVINVGDGNDLTISHDGTDTTIASGTGDLYINNTLSGSSTIARLGSATTSSDMRIQDNGGKSWFIWDASGRARNIDNAELSLGSGFDYTMVHDGSNTSITSTTGNLITDNTNTTGDTIFRLGSDTNSSHFRVQNNSETDMLSVNASGETITGSDLVVQGRIAKTTTISTVGSAANVVYTAAQMWGGLIARDPSGSDRSDTTDTAANIVSGITGAEVGSSFKFSIDNTANADETITVSGGSGVTLSGVMTIAQNETRSFMAVCTNITGSSEAVTLYDLGSNTAMVTAGGSDTQLQFNNAGAFDGSATITTDGTDLQMAAGDITLADSDSVIFGAGSDLTVSHDGTDSSIVSVTGDFTIDNQLVTGSTIMLLGTDTSATDFQVQNDSASAVFTVDGAGSTTVTGTFDVSGISNLNDTTQSTASTNGALIIDGGVGIAKDVFCAGSMNAVDFNATSDATKKQDIQTINDALSKIDGIDAVQYRFNFLENDHLRYGVLAQDLQSNGLGDIVSSSPEGLKVDYNNLTGLLIGAVKELKAEVEMLKNANV